MACLSNYLDLTCSTLSYFILGDLLRENSYSFIYCIYSVLVQVFFNEMLIKNAERVVQFSSVSILLLNIIYVYIKDYSSTYLVTFSGEK